MPAMCCARHLVPLPCGALPTWCGALFPRAWKPTSARCQVLAVLPALRSCSVWPLFGVEVPWLAEPIPLPRVATACCTLIWCVSSISFIFPRTNAWICLGECHSPSAFKRASPLGTLMISSFHVQCCVCCFTRLRLGQLCVLDEKKGDLFCRIFFQPGHCLPPSTGELQHHEFRWLDVGTGLGLCSPAKAPIATPTCVALNCIIFFFCRADVWLCITVSTAGN